MLPGLHAAGPEAARQQTKLQATQVYLLDRLLKMCEREHQPQTISSPTGKLQTVEIHL